jgi:hypothetical protein
VTRDNIVGFDGGGGEGGIDDEQNLRCDIDVNNAIFGCLVITKHRETRIIGRVMRLVICNTRGGNLRTKKNLGKKKKSIL